MRILVAGGQGQVGSALSEIGLEQGLDLISLTSQQLDITNSNSIARAFSQYQPKILINAAAYTAVDKAEIEPEAAYLINDKAVGLLADVCAEYKIPMLHISTDYVFDGSKVQEYMESDPVNPLSVYGKSKEAGECTLRKRLPEHIILRTSWVFSQKGDNFVNTMVRLSKSRTQLSVVADQFGGPSSARAIADILLKIITQYQAVKSVAWGTYHFSQKPHVSWCEFAKVIISKAMDNGLINHPVEVLPIPSRDFPALVERPKNSCLNTDHLSKRFCLSDSYWQDDLSKVLETFRDEA